MTYVNCPKCGHKLLEGEDGSKVQVKKDASNKKGARVSTHISLPGEYIVLMPDVSFINVYKKKKKKKKKAWRTAKELITKYK